MKRLMYFAISVVLASVCEAQAVRGLADVSIIDRDTGVVLDTHYYRGEYWVAGRPGGRYAIEIHNHLGERLLAVTSVDGVNVVSGETAAWDQGGYVFGPGDRYQITGWRKSDAEVAAFTFTDLANSYAARTGRPANVGVIGVATSRLSAVYRPIALRLRAGLRTLRAQLNPGRCRHRPRSPRRNPGQNSARVTANAHTRMSITPNFCACRSNRTR
jgi:hypothetical protein